MLLTKKEFAEMYGYASEKSVSNLITRKKIVINSNGLINTDDNKEFCEKQKAKLKKINEKDNAETEVVSSTKQVKPQEQLALELDMLNSRLDERRGRTELLQLKIAKEKGSLVEASVLNNVIRMTFEDMFKTLMEFPNIYAMEIINIVHAEENPREILVEWLTNKMNEAIKIGLNNARQAAKKYYKE